MFFYDKLFLSFNYNNNYNYKKQKIKNKKYFNTLV